MIAAVIAAGLADRPSESTGATDRFDDGFLKPHCSVAPKGVDGIPCTWHTLAPLKQ